MMNSRYLILKVILSGIPLKTLKLIVINVKKSLNMLVLMNINNKNKKICYLCRIFQLTYKKSNRNQHNTTIYCTKIQVQ